MSITKYFEETSPGVRKTLYMVMAEGINRYTGKRVQKKRKGITSEAKAERIYRELWNECREERLDQLSISRWGELKASYFDHIHSIVRTVAKPDGLSPDAYLTKRSRFIHLANWDGLHLDAINTHFVNSELNRLEAEGVISRPLSVCIQKELRCMMSYAIDRGFLKLDPLAGMKKRKLPKRKKEALTHDETDKLLLEARLRKHPYFLIWLLTLMLGLRRSELAGLKWGDLDFANRLIHLRRQWKPKEGIVEKLKDNEDRTVAIPLSVIPVLHGHRAQSRSDFVIDIDCHRWRSGNQAEVLRAFCKEIGIKEVTHHQLRATHITLALVDGIPLGIVKENVGHAKLSTTDEYFRSSGIQMRGQTDGLRIKVPSGLEADVLPLRAKR